MGKENNTVGSCITIILAIGIIIWGIYLESNFATLLCGCLGVFLFSMTVKDIDRRSRFLLAGLGTCTLLYAETIESTFFCIVVLTFSFILIFSAFGKTRTKSHDNAKEVADTITRNMEKRAKPHLDEADYSNDDYLDDDYDFNDDEDDDNKEDTSNTAFKELRHYRDEARKRMSEEYFYQVNCYLSDLFDFATQLDNDASFKEHCNNLENINIKFTDGDTFGALDARSFRGKLLIIFLVDMVRNFEHAGHPLDLWKQEEFGILLYIYLFNNEGRETDYKTDYNTVSLFYTDSHINVMEDFVRQFMAWPEMEEVFFMSHLLKGYSGKLLKRYHFMMYSIVSLTANCDGTISKEEEEWMEKILTMAEDTSQTPKQEEKKEEKTASSLATMEESFAKLNELIGLSSVKQEVRTLANLIKIQQRRREVGLKTTSPSYHCVFTGNPGTGKTTVARILADIYHSLGILEKGHLVETDRSGLVAEYVGQTAVKTNKIIDKALDGVLFIDEAYTLVNSSENDYGKEAIATLLKRMEDDRKRLVVILAGYTNEMKAFIDSNPGLQSRFNRYVEFPDYSPDELLRVFEMNVSRYDYTLTPEAHNRLAAIITKAVQTKDQNFGNARFVRNLFDKTIERQSCRLAAQNDVSVQELSGIIADDIPNSVGCENSFSQIKRNLNQP